MRQHQLWRHLALAVTLYDEGTERHVKAGSKHCAMLLIITDKNHIVMPINSSLSTEVDYSITMQRVYVILGNLTRKEDHLRDLNVEGC